jgi:hypothetical protein
VGEARGTLQGLDADGLAGYAVRRVQRLKVRGYVLHLQERLALAAVVC